MARTNFQIDEALKGDIEVISSITGEPMAALFDKAALAFVESQEPKIKNAVEAARKARK